MSTPPMGEFAKEQAARIRSQLRADGFRAGIRVRAVGGASVWVTIAPNTWIERDVRASIRKADTMPRLAVIVEAG